MIKRHQTVFFHIIWIKTWSWGHSGCSAVGWMGKVVMTDNPSEAASWLKNSTGNVLAKLLLTCCPIDGIEGEREKYLSTGVYTHKHTSLTQHTVTSVCSHNAKLVQYKHCRCTQTHFKTNSVIISAWNCKHETLIYHLFYHFSKKQIIWHITAEEAQWSYINKPYGR